MDGRIPCAPQGAWGSKKTKVAGRFVRTKSHSCADVARALKTSFQVLRRLSAYNERGGEASQHATDHQVEVDLDHRRQQAASTASTSADSNYSFNNNGKPKEAPASKSYAFPSSFRIVNTNTKKVLTQDADYNVYATKYTSPNQIWSYDAQTCAIVNCITGKALDIERNQNGGNIVARVPNQSPSQQWDYDEKKGIVWNGSWNRAVEIQNGDVNVCAWEFNGGSNQTWQIVEHAAEWRVSTSRFRPL
uniref:Ricin B lectin domain-containing protein n=1 Tax=Lotharella globosa TaxID=91324 RepID=A0A7S4DH31_9EUKA